jgi:hypothetical protein
MTKHLLYCLIAISWLIGCSEDPVSIGSGPGGSTASNLDIIPAAADSLYKEEIPLIGANQLWVGQLNDYAVSTRLMLQFFELDTTAAWLVSDTLTLDSISLVLSHRTDGLGQFFEGAHAQLKLRDTDLNCENCSNFTELVYSHLYDVDNAPLFVTMDSLLIPNVNSTDTLTRTLLPFEWFFENDNTVFQDTVSLLLEMDYQSDQDSTGDGFMHTFNAKDTDVSSWPRLEFFYHSDTGIADTLVEYVRYDTYLLRDYAVPEAGDLFVSAGDAWQFALQFNDLEYRWEDGVRTDELHSIVTETIHSAQIRLFPKSFPAETAWRYGGFASTQVWDLLSWDAEGTIEIDTLIAQTSFTEGAGEFFVDINVTRLVNRWITREDYTGVVMRVSQANDNLNPVRMVYHGLADTTGLSPELFIYRSESPF